MRSFWFAPVCIVVMALFGAVVYRWLPEQAPPHWLVINTEEVRDRIWAVAFSPTGTAFLWLFWVLSPYIDPRRAAYKTFSGSYHFFINAIILLYTVLHIAGLIALLGWPVSVFQILVIGWGLFYMASGNEMGRVRAAYFIGVRTPWTLSDPAIWQRTHRVGARLMFVTGLLIVLVGLFCPINTALPIMLAMIVSTTLFLFWYSYHLSRQHIKVKS